MKADQLHGIDHAVFIGSGEAVDVQQIIGTVLPVLSGSVITTRLELGLEQWNFTPVSQQDQATVDLGDSTTENTMETMVLDLVGSEWIVTHEIRY